MPATSPTDWRAHVASEPGDFLLNHVRLVLYRRRVDSVDAIDVDATVWRTIRDGEAAPPTVGIPIPTAALAALRDAIDEHLGKRYDESLVGELRTSLAVERARVDNVLATINQGH